MELPASANPVAFELDFVPFDDSNSVVSFPEKTFSSSSFLCSLRFRVLVALRVRIEKEGACVPKWEKI